MKKKIIAFFLCVLMLVSITTPTVSAASLISRIRPSVSSTVYTAAGTEVLSAMTKFCFEKTELASAFFYEFALTR